MRSSHDSDGAPRNGMTRRDLLKAGAVVGLGAGVVGGGFLGAGCGGGDESGGGDASPSASAAAGSVKPGGIMTLATDQLYPNQVLDTLKNTEDGIDALQGMLREGLVTYDFNFVTQPRLAERWETNEELTEYTFYMRPNVTWHDGSPFSARDAAWSLERILDPAEGSLLNDRLLQSIDKVVVVDDMTLKLELKRPDSLLMMPLSNQQAYLTKENDADYEAGIGTGPFKLKSFNPGQSYEVEKYAGYWEKGAPILDGVRGLQIPEPSTKLQAVASGDSDVTQIAFDQLSVVKANPDLQINPYEKGIAYNVVCQLDAEPWKKPGVVEALKRSLDRKKVIEVAFAGQGFASPDAWVAMGDPFMTPELEERTKVDLAKAQELMAAAGYPDGIDLELKVPGDALHANFGLGIVAGLEGSPFRVTSKQVPSDTYWDTTWNKDPFCVDDWNRRHPVETMVLNVSSTAPYNESRFYSPEMDELLEAALAASGDAQTEATSVACLYMSENSGEIVPAYLNRLWTSKVGTLIVPWTFSMLDFRKCGFLA
jgi:peptide/nickel transport system substrate-binding protein